MDLKGLSWVGNFYEKFEAMCLEVEEVIYQDTVEYVENQAQTVCSSMKKLYSDVMQDLLPPSEDAAKGGDFYGDVGIYMKPKIGKKEKTAKFNDIKKVTEGQIKAANCNSSLSSESNLRTRKSSKRDNSTQNEQSGNSTPLASRQNVEGRKLNEVSKIDASYGKDVNENHNLFHEVAKIRTPRFEEETDTNDFAEESQDKAKIAEISTGGPSSDLVKSDQYDMSEEMDMRDFSGSALLVEANDANIFSDDEANSLVDSCSNWQVESDEIACGEDFLYSSGSSNGCNTEVNEDDASFLSEVEVIQQPDKANLEESCILVNRDDFRFVACHEGRSKSYQKKMRDVFSPRRSSTRKLEYEQLAMWPTVDDSNLKKIPSLTVKDEAEWELL